MSKFDAIKKQIYAEWFNFNIILSFKMKKGVSNVVAFFVGVGFVNTVAYPYLKNYQERNQTELRQISEEHSKVINETKR